MSTIYDEQLQSSIAYMFQLYNKNLQGISKLLGDNSKLLGLDKNGMNEIIYKKWTTIDRFTLETLIKLVGDLVDELITKLMNVNLLTHSFVAKEQNKFFDESKLKESELVICDFSKNYSDEDQEFH